MPDEKRPPRKLFSVYLSPDTLERLKALAARRDETMASLIRLAVLDLLAKYEAPKGRSRR